MNFLKLIKAESYTKGMVLSVIFNIISKGILFLLTIIIARYFGSNIKTDIYFFVFAAMVLFSGLINNMDTAVLIPQIQQKQALEFCSSLQESFEPIINSKIVAVELHSNIQYAPHPLPCVRKCNTFIPLFPQVSH